ncbi:MAG TPA: class A beta-lactamase, subclass A2 [Chryseosolibacter sp.]|nr:class A beta-lactamase, subclass A2 [Chryseosolibacter sp.]
MKKILTPLIWLVVSVAVAQPNSYPLTEKLDEIISGKDAVVGVSIISQDGTDTLTINGNRRFPMQSVFKLHIGMYVLSLVDRKILSLDQKLSFSKDKLRTDWWSPIAKKYPEGATLPLRDVLGYTIGQSDNNGCEVLLDLVGGPKVVGTFFKHQGFKDVEIAVSETDMHEKDDAQYLNWSTPREASVIMKSLYEGRLLSRSSTDFLMKVLSETVTGPKRIRGQLPSGTMVAHKTGTSGINGGVMAAVNDMGMITLPNGKVLFLTVFVTDSRENLQENERIIAEVSKAVFDFYASK